jgi:Tol biopolymer transport system component
MRFRNWFLVLGICLGFSACGLGFPAQAATWLDPGLKWKTLETEHFYIHYYPAIEEQARKLAPIAEEVNQTITDLFEYKLDLKTHVALMDVTDYGNGMTTVFPYPNIVLYLTDLSSNLNPYKYDDYLRYLFLHEYVHAIHLDLVEGGLAATRAVLGRLIFPNAIEPSFMTEGIATYLETAQTNAGRGRDPRWLMMMRMDVLENNVKTIDQAAVTTVRWPQGHLRYLYGVMFLEYLAQKYGERELLALTHSYGDFLFSTGIDEAFKAHYGKSLGVLWQEWLVQLKAQCEQQRSALGKLTEPQLLTVSGNYNLQPKWTRDGRWLYYLQQNVDDYPQIRRVSVQNQRSEKVLEARVSDDRFSFTPNGKALLFAKADVYDNYYTYKDLYQLELNSNRLTRLSKGVRATDPTVSSNGRQIAFIVNRLGQRRLEQADLSIGLKNRQFFKVEEGTQYFSPVYNPVGRHIAVAKRLQNGNQVIAMVDFEADQEVELTDAVRPTTEAFSEANPVFSPAGDYLFFDADYTGIVNLYALQLASGRLFQVTNVIGGAMMPDVSPDGKRLAYVSYSSRGYDVAVLDMDTASWKEIGGGSKPPVSDLGEGSKLRVSEVGARNTAVILTPESATRSVLLNPISTDYNPWPQLRPRFWIPDSYVTNTGGQTSVYIAGVDPLGQHAYYLNGGFDFSAGKPFYSLVYANNQYLPQITLGLYRLTVGYNWSGQAYWEEQQEADLLFSFFNNRVFKESDKMAFTVGLGTVNLGSITDPSGLTPPLPDRGNLNSLILAWRYLSTRGYAASISNEDGIDLSLRAEMFTPTLKSDFTFTNYSASLSNYTRLPLPHHVLATTLNGFASRGYQMEQGNFNYKYINVRGYPYGNLIGDKGASLSLEYRLPLGYPENGPIYGFTFFDRLWGTFFFDYGNATYGSASAMALKRGVGAEVNIDWSTFWSYYLFSFKLGYAKGLDSGGTENLYFNIGL